MTAWFRDHQEFTVIDWPSRSPDLNPIEILWGIMVNEWTDRNERTPDVLERHYMEVWESIPRVPELCQQLLQSMRRRMQDCIENGSRTKNPSSQNPPPAKTPLRLKPLFSKKKPLAKKNLQPKPPLAKPPSGQNPSLTKNPPLAKKHRRQKLPSR